MVEISERGLLVPEDDVKLVFNGAEFSDIEGLIAAMKAGGGIVQLADRGHSGAVGGGRDSAVLARINELLDDKENFTATCQQMFNQYARGGYLDQRGAIAMGRTLGVKYNLPSQAFEHVTQMFYRFDFSGDERLDFKEAKRLVKFVLKQYVRELEPSAPGCRLYHLPRKDLRREYDLGKKLGQGGQGAVYLAKEKATGVPRVVKFYTKSGTNECPLEDIKDEFELLKRLDHPHIAKVCEVFEDIQNVYVVSEPYGGGDLSDLALNARKHGVAVTHEWLGKIFLQCLRGIEYMHSKQMMHCDIKQPNIMIADDSHWSNPHTVLIDFGMAKDFGGNRVGGTPGYIPPEFWQMQLWSPKGDMFALAVTWWCIYNGRPVGGPFLVQPDSNWQRTAHATMYQQMSTTAFPPGLRELITHMSAKDFKRRISAKRALESSYFQNLANMREEIGSNVLKLLEAAANRSALQNMVALDLAEKQNMGQQNSLNNLFKQLDKDGDGNVDREEATRGLRALGMSSDKVSELVESLVGEDDKLKYTEFMARLLAAQKSMRSIDLASVFQKLDKDGNGVLTRSELDDMMKQKHMESLLDGRSADDLLREMDLDGSGSISFEEFRRAMLGETVRPSALFNEGDAVQYYSSTYGRWIDCSISKVDARTGSVEINIKQGAWFSTNDQGTKLRKPSGAGSGRPSAAGSARLAVGDAVEYHSTTAGGWLACTISKVDASTGAVEISVKPGAMFSPGDQATKLRRAAQRVVDVVNFAGNPHCSREVDSESSGEEAGGYKKDKKDKKSKKEKKDKS